LDVLSGGKVNEEIYTDALKIYLVFTCTVHIKLFLKKLRPDPDPESTKSLDPDPDPNSKFNDSGSTTLLQSEGVSKIKPDLHAGQSEWRGGAGGEAGRGTGRLPG
jgi:hypothetical protein